MGQLSGEPNMSAHSPVIQGAAPPLYRRVLVVWPFSNSNQAVLNAIAAFRSEVLPVLKGIQMTQQAIETDVSAIAGDLTTVSGNLADVSAQAGNISNALVAIAAQIAAGQPVDLTTLNALVATAGTMATTAAAAQAAVDAAATSVAALATPPAPAPTPAPQSSSSKSSAAKDR
jgi:hypothetical protein